MDVCIDEPRKPVSYGRDSFVTRSDLPDIVAKLPQRLKRKMTTDRVVVDYQDPDVLIACIGFHRVPLTGRLKAAANIAKFPLSRV